MTDGERERGWNTYPLINSAFAHKTQDFQVKGVAQNFISISHMASRDSTIGAITCCLQGCVLEGRSIRTEPGVEYRHSSMEYGHLNCCLNPQARCSYSTWKVRISACRFSGHTDIQSTAATNWDLQVSGLIQMLPLSSFISKLSDHSVTRSTHSILNIQSEQFLLTLFSIFVYIMKNFACFYFCQAFLEQEFYLPNL